MRPVARGRAPSRWLATLALLSLVSPVLAQATFVNFETPHVRPLDITPDGLQLLAVNTADNRLMVFDLTTHPPVQVASVLVGLDPVSVRARSNSEAWVVNRLSDSVSIVDLSTRRVRASLQTSDEPGDVVFAGSPQRAFVSCSQFDRIQVFDPQALAAPPIVVPIVGREPRALAVSPDGSKVYAAIFQSGNHSTVLSQGILPEGFQAFPLNVLANPATPYGGVSPPPNDGANFDPPLNPALPQPLPEIALIVRKIDGVWRDDNGADWTPWISGANSAASNRPPGWDLADHDLAIVDAQSLAVSYVSGLMTTDMALAVSPDDGRVVVVGTEATNEIRFEPNLKGRFIQVLAAVVDAGSPGAPVSGVQDLNPHLAGAEPTVPQAVRDLSLGDPRGAAFEADGARLWVAGMGSNNLVVLDADGQRVAGPIEVGEGPTGVVVDDVRQRVYVLNKFEASLSVVDMVSLGETARVPFFDPTPEAVRLGRPVLYDTHATSGQGQLSCASCHLDARWDGLAWELGDPSGSEQPQPPDQNINANSPALTQPPAPDFHPLKGPMVTQSLTDIIGKEPFHWRGDRTGIEAFAPAFVGLLGDDAQPNLADMTRLKGFLASIHYPPNPNRNLDNSLSTSVDLTGHFTPGGYGSPPGVPMGTGNAVAGLARFQLDVPTIGACTRCHTLPTGFGTDTKWNGSQFAPIPPGPDGERHHMLRSQLQSKVWPIKVPSLRDAYRKVGFNLTQTVNTSGFGVIQDGTMDSVERFNSRQVDEEEGLQMLKDLLAFELSFTGSDLPQGSPTNVQHPPGTPSQDAHAAVGRQLSFASPAGAPGQMTTLLLFVQQANQQRVGLVARARMGGLERGFRHVGGSNYQSDRQVEVVNLGTLLAGAAPGSEVTFTVVPTGSATRIGIDRDLDGFLDRDELDAGSDPADPDDVPGTWLDLGAGLAGTHGVPQLTGQGSLAALTQVSLTLDNALESSSFVAIGGFSPAVVWFFGGTLVPYPDIMIFGLPTTPSGEATLSAQVPASGFPPGQAIYFQFWVWDAAGVQGLAATNGLRATAP